MSDNKSRPSYARLLYLCSDVLSVSLDEKPSALDRLGAALEVLYRQAFSEPVPVSSIPPQNFDVLTNDEIARRLYSATAHVCEYCISNDTLNPDNIKALLLYALSCVNEAYDVWTVRARKEGGYGTRG